VHRNPAVTLNSTPGNAPRLRIDFSCMSHRGSWPILRSGSLREEVALPTEKNALSMVDVRCEIRRSEMATSVTMERASRELERGIGLPRGVAPAESVATVRLRW
jgi:hypothetical protein